MINACIRRKAFTRAQKLSVYEPRRAELTRGDIVRVTRNDAALDLANGDRFKVEKVEAKRVTLANGVRRVELPTAKPLHLDHAYATTVHSAQGLTSDRVLIDADSKSRTTTKEVYYVAISRPRDGAAIFTDDKSKLPRAITRATESPPPSTSRSKKAERHALPRMSSMATPAGSSPSRFSWALAEASLGAQWRGHFSPNIFSGDLSAVGHRSERVAKLRAEPCHVGVVARRQSHAMRLGGRWEQAVDHQD